MAMFRSNGAALLVLFEILQERLSAWGDRPYRLTMCEVLHSSSAPFAVVE
jgi:hypothetical protein